jgi:hypothetical protein
MRKLPVNQRDLPAGEALPVLHHETYDFPDVLTPVGIELWLQIALGATGNDAMTTAERAL